MATPKLIAQALTTIENAKKYLQDQGSPTDNHVWLAMHINAASAWIQSFTGRKRLVWIDETYTEYYDGDNSSEIYVNELPLIEVVQIITLPFSGTGGAVTYTGPTAPAIDNDDMYFISEDGLIVAKTFGFPQGVRSVRIDYQAGYYAEGDESAGSAPSPERTMLEMIVLEAISLRWRRWKNQSAGVKTRTDEGATITYKDSDFDKATLDWLKLLQRQMWV